MKNLLLMIKIWYYNKKFLKAKTKQETFSYMFKLKQAQQIREQLQKNKGSRLAAFIRQMKQR
jgi:hypothetical protein